MPLLELNRVVLLEHYKNSKFTGPDNYIWPNKSGGPLSESDVNCRFTESILQLGLRKIRLYDLRHGHITELLNDGVPDKQIQERVGHASATMTKDRYGHFMVGAQEESIRKWERTRFVKTSASEAGTPGATRTPDKQFRKLLLYPPELLGLNVYSNNKAGALQYYPSTLVTAAPDTSTMAAPPSINKAAPVMNVDSSLAR